MKYLIMAGIFGGTGGMIWAGTYFGGRWIDKMLCVRPPLDPSKPIVRPIQASRGVWCKKCEIVHQMPIKDECWPHVSPHPNGDRGSAV